MTRSAQAIGAIAKKRGQAASLGAPFEPDWQISSALPVALMCQLPKFFYSPPMQGSTRFRSRLMFALGTFGGMNFALREIFLARTAAATGQYKW